MNTGRTKQRLGTASVTAMTVVLGLLACVCVSSRSVGGDTGQIAFVAYAGSLTMVNDQYLGPAFKKATGFGYQSHAGGSFGLANLIKAREIEPSVFESVGNAPIVLLEPAFTTWSAGFAAKEGQALKGPAPPSRPLL